MPRQRRRSTRIIHVRCRSSSSKSIGTEKNTDKDKKFLSQPYRFHRSRVSPTVAVRSELSASRTPFEHAVSMDSEETDKFKSQPIRTDSISMNSTAQLNADKNDLSQDHHRKQKTKTSSQSICIFVILMIIGAIIIAVSITLGLLLTRKNNQGYKSDKPAILRWNATGTIVAGLGSGGVMGNLLSYPLGFAMNQSNTLYIAEHLGNRVTRWIPGAPNGTVIAGLSNGTASNASQGFFNPSDILLESNGDMYITDRWNHRLQFWKASASSGTTLAGNGANSSISLRTPLSIVRNSKTQAIYITSSFSHTIVSYPSGQVFGTAYVAGNTNHLLNRPDGLLYDSSTDSLIIGNGAGHTIVRWNLASTNWTLIAGVPGVSGNNATHLNRPIGLTMDPMGNIYVADFDNSRVQLFFNGQSQGVTIVGTGTNGTSLSRAGAVKLDSQLNLFVSDVLGSRILKFQRY